MSDDEKDKKEGKKPQTEAEKAARVHNNPFAQQTISAWEPVIAPRWTIVALVLLGIAFVLLGLFLIHTTHSVTDCQVQYADPDSLSCLSGVCTNTVTFDSGSCSGKDPQTDVNGAQYIAGPVYMYYQLTNFYQNHRRYVLSRNNDQLAGEKILDLDALSACEPALIADDGYRILMPCGLVARSVFNDSFAVTDGKGVPMTLHDSVSDIIWPPEYADMFHNPPDDGDPALKKLDQWLPEDVFPGRMENPHFMTWMRNAALPDFRKLYARLDGDVYLPVTVSITNRYPVSPFGGKKYVVMATTNWLGGKNPFLGYAYAVVGGILFIIGIVFAVKERRNPRSLGDVRYLRWNKAKAA